MSLMPSLSSSLSPTLQSPSESVSVPSLATLKSFSGPKPSTPIAQSSQLSLSRSRQTNGLRSLSSGPSLTPSLSSSLSPSLQSPSESVSVPSLATLLSASGPNPSVPIAQSSQESLSASVQMSGLRLEVSGPSAMPSLSSSGSPSLHRPSESVSVPSLFGVESLSGPVSSVPMMQSSQVSPSLSPQTSGSVSFGSVPTTTPSLSASLSPASQAPSRSVSRPSLSGRESDSGPVLSVPTLQSSHVSASLSPQMSGLLSFGSGPSRIPSLSSSVSSPESWQPSLS